MKKIAFGILSVFMILGGVLLSACSNEVSLSVSSQEVVIYTNDDQKENFKQKEIEVTLENSTAGIGVEVSSGAKCIDIEKTNTTTPKANGKYAFKILTKDDDTSGKAEVKVYAIEDKSKEKIINVSVMTVLESLVSVNDDSVDARSKMFVVKGQEKTLDAENYFDFNPISANVKDIDWTFEDSNSKELKIDGEIVATINENKLNVLTNFTLNKISLVASFKDNSKVSNTVTFDVLNNSTIKNFTLDGEGIIENNVVRISGQNVKLKRNNSAEAVAQGSIEINTTYDIDFSVDAYQILADGTKYYLSEEDVANNFNFDIVEEKTLATSHTYKFNLDAYDYFNNGLCGKYYLVFNVDYKDYDYSITTKEIEISIETSYAATRVDLYDGENRSIDSSVALNVFSSYNAGQGFEVKAVVQPENRTIDNNMFRFVVDTNQSALASASLDPTNPISDVFKIFYKGKLLTFKKEGSLYVSSELVSGDEAYITAVDTYRNVEVDVQSLSNTDVYSRLVLNLFKISDDESLSITNADDSEIEKNVYISSSLASSKTMSFEYKIKGISSESGLSLNTVASDKFEFSNYEVVSVSDTNDEKYIVVRFSVKLLTSKFEEKAKFSFVHLTGKTSETVTIQAFVPIETAYIQNMDASSADVFHQESATMGYELTEDGVVASAFANNSLSKLVLEASTTIKLKTETSNATLAEDKIKFKYLSYEDVQEFVDAYGLGIDVEEIFDNADFDTISMAYNYFDNASEFSTFAITSDKLIVNDATFKGVVAVEVYGYNEEHKQTVFVRFFTIESVYSVRYLSPNVKTKLLYTTETLSQKDMNLSYVDVVLSLRPDSKVPSYSNDLRRLSFASAGLELEKVSDTYYKNQYYTITDVDFVENGRKITFRVTANSTNLLTVFNDVISVTYKDINHIKDDVISTEITGKERKAEISIEIRNVKRIENVEWMNKPLDGKIYLNLTAATNSEKEFTISTSVLPADANDIKLTYKYFATSGAASDLNVNTSEVGQTVNVNINTSIGGTGFLYLLPSDMIKSVEGTDSLLLYKYSEVDGKIVETPYYDIKLNDLSNFYKKIIEGVDDEGNEIAEFDNYFYNNDGEKIFYKDIILKIEVVIADGRSQETRIRLYNQGDFENMDSSLFYEVMNDISFYGWESKTEFKGSIDGNGHTFKFVKWDESDSENRKNQTFVNVLSKTQVEGSGTLLNINFTGFVYSQSNTYAGFIANQVAPGAQIINCTIDVYSEANNYMPSELRSISSNYTGGVVGQNNGTLSNVKVYGLSMKGLSGDLISAKIGGIAGCNAGLIENCGYELYNFGDTTKTTIANTNGDFGGLIGYADSSSRAIKSYVYDFGGNYNAEKTIGFAYTVNIASKVVSFEECFAYLGNVNTLFDNSNSVLMKNSYITFKQDDEYVTKYYDQNGNEISSFDGVTVDETVWFVEGTTGFDVNVNFAHSYLRNVLPSATVNLEELNVADVEGKCSNANGNGDVKKGVLYIYNPVQTITNVAEKSELDSYNTISVATLFGVTEYQARSLLLTSTSTNVLISANQIKVVNSTFAEFEVVAHLKTNFSQTVSFKFVVLNAIPKITTTLNGLTIKENQTLMLQNGKTKNIVYNFDSKVALNGNLYALQKDSYNIEYSLADEDKQYVNISKTGNVLVLNGKEKVDNVSIDTNVVVVGLDGTYKTATLTQKNFNVCVFNGTTALSVSNADGIVVKASKYANFEVYMNSDDYKIDGSEKKLLDNLHLTLKNGEIEVEGRKVEENKIVFDIDERLSLEAFWSYKNINENLFKFDVVIKICDENRHLIDENYEDLKLFVNAESQKENTEYVKQIDFVVETQEVESTSIAFYEIAMRQYKNSRLHYIKSSNTLTTVSPSSDLILAVTISPAYAKADSFNLTYTMSGSGNYGTINVAKLDSDINGFYISQNYNVIENGVNVVLSEDEKKGDGVFYFRVYISSLFSGEIDLRFNLEVFGQTNVKSSKSLTVSALREASVKVDGSTRTVLAKGKEAKVEITVGVDQAIYNLYLENCGQNISLVFDKNQEPVYDGANKIYEATLYAGFDSKLSNGSESGVFYVCATVERTINGVQEFKTTTATVYLVDFALDLDETKVSNTRKTAVYNGKTYDVLTSYLNDSQILNFDYTLLPQNYTYDMTNEAEIESVERIEEKKIEFRNKNYYSDADSGYYINYVYNTNRGTYEVVKLRNQLWYATSESYVTNVYNETAQRFNGGNGYFALEENSNGNIIITGKRTGLQLMMLRTTVICQGEEFVYDYFFLVQVEVYTDEDSPKTIRSAEEFLKVTEESDAADYILMNDIVLDNYTPIDSDKFRSLDGNGYTIHLNSFALPSDSSELNLALFNNVAYTSTLKNLKVNIYNGGQIAVDVNTYKTINIAGFAISNKGIIYNCEVVSYYDNNYQTSRLSGKTGIVVSYTNGAGTDAIEITSLMGVESNVAGFVVNNEEGSTDDVSSISNSRVGGLETYHALIEGGVTFRQTIQLPTFYIVGQGTVSGFAVKNDGVISASYAKNIQIENQMQSTSSITAGFVVENNLNVKNSFVEGLGGSVDVETLDPLPYNDKTSIKSMGVVAGFVYENAGKVLNSYSNIKIEKPYLSAGFVFRNTNTGSISLCYSASLVDEENVGQMKFCGVNAYAVSQNEGEISLSYFYKKSRLSDGESVSGEPSGVYGVNEVFDVSTFYGFSFNSSEGSYDGIWEMRYEGLTLVSANTVAFSNRYAKIVGEVETVFYNKNVRDYETYEVVDVSYGSVNNPIIIRNAEDFAKATGKATTTEISSYKEYYTDTEVLGAYRIVKDIDMTDVAQNADETNAIRLRTTTKTFKGILDGNGFTIANISLGSSIATENYGLFAKISEAVIMNIDFTVESVHNTEANIVGALAGTAYNTRILSVSLSPASTNQQTESANTAVQGNNIVGGVVGIVLGDSYICNVQVENMDVESAFYDKNKKIDTNYKNYTQNLRSAFNATNSIRSIVANLSYAGAVAGYVDIYYGETDDYAKFSENLTVNDYNVLSVDVSGTVNIYGEVVGGIFGYIGSSTYIYDIDLELNSQPSHIISKNLFAGGIVGESYGGMYAVSSHFDSQTELSIERNENNYYNGSYANKGQETIFSYAQNEEGSFEKINAPLFIGGVAGYMGGGYIYIGYSKLNVISTSEKTVAAGGIVGLLGKTSNYYSLDFVSIAVSTNYLFRDVYASGDVYTSNGCAGGIIGSVQKESGIACDIALKNVMALNLFTNSDTKLNVESEYSTNTFTLIGKVCVEAGAGYALENAADRYNGNIYLINNESSVQYNAGTGETKSETGSPTVGGYSSIANKTATISNLDAFGFLTRSANNNARLLLTNPIGGAEFSTGSFESYSYARNYSYFIGNGWAEKFWRHEQDTLLPYIELTPRLDVLFWDVYNTEKVLQEMNNSSLTVVIRGRISPSINDIHCSDINLTSESVQSLIGDGLKFRGKLYSYEKYMNTSEGGQIDVEAIAGVGGKTGETAGLIIDKTLFDNIYSSAIVDGVKFYVNTTDKFTGVVNTIEDSVVRNVKVFYREKAKLSAEAKGTSLNKKNAAGVLAQTAISTNIMNCEIVFKENEDIVFAANDTTTDEESYYGLIVGYFEQQSKFTNISLQNNLIRNAKNVTLSCDKTGSYSNGKVHFGLYAGYAKQASNAKIEVVMLELLSDVNIKLDKVNATYAYVGGYVGKVENISSLTFQKREGGSGSCEFTFEYTNSGIGNLSQGALVGEISGGTYSITGSQMKIVSQNTSTNNISSANIGGLVGNSDSSFVTITSFVVETKVGDKDNSMEFKNSSAVGGLVGNVNGGKCTVSNCSSIGGDIYVEGSADIYAGGLVGNVTANAQMEVSGQIINETNLNVVSTTEAYVGGAVGNVNGEIVDCQKGLSTLYRYYGNINISASTVYVGGFAGKVSASNSTISNVVCGGEINCNNANSGTSIYVGGVVGSLASSDESSDESEISNCFAFSDVYVNYAENDTSRLSVYDFGGIVGSASKVKIKTCKSLTSNFNTRNITINDSNGSKIIYNCGAICGNNAGDVSYENNMYCSGVNLEYQKDSGNTDCAYLDGENNTYYGYSNSAKTTGENKISATGKGILSFVSTYVEQGNEFRNPGEKLSPIQWDENSHTITTGNWYTLTENIEINSVLTETLSSKTRFVGNGFVITRNSASQAVSGGLFNTISGGSVSNVIVNANMTEASSIENNKVSFGGVTGVLRENGIVYGVGVNGLVSINDANNLGGLVGSINGGLISNCYFDGDLEYRGGSSQKTVSGLVGIVSGDFNTVLSSYSSGMIVTYVNCTANQFASIATDQLVDFVDCYSIIQLDNDSNVEDNPNVSLNAVSGTQKNSSIGGMKIDVTAISYSEDSISNPSMSADAASGDHFTWYYDKFVNYGYAAHGFGFLRDAEIKVFNLSNPIEKDDSASPEYYIVDGTSGDNAEYYRYSYSIVALSDLSEEEENEYYFEIPNLAKFDQIENSKKFILRYDIDLKSTGKFATETLENFVFDGQGHNLKNYTKNYALFDTIVNGAIIRNVNMTNATIDPKNGDVGVLASVNNGKIYNVYVEGNITSNIANANVGGVVGVNGGKIFLAEACVNITNEAGAISGGIAGQNSGTISYASSNGMIVNEATSGSVGVSCAVENSETTVSVTSIQGGIVGYMTAGSVSNSYNTNSVLGNYIESSTAEINTVSGGIVGYITNGTIDNSVNAGLVGAGNYNNSASYSYAGGIVGYAASNIRVDVTNCVNDGPVQALGKVDYSAQSQTIKHDSNNVGSDNEDLTYNPKTLTFEVTNKFNVRSDRQVYRQVYAFGIGFGLEDIDSDNNITSSDNIKNDGIIGVKEQTGTITFDRKAILDNNSNNDFYASFALQSKDGNGYTSTVSGYDSYGFVTRLYMIDQITRQYGKESNDITSALAKTVTNTNWDTNEKYQYSGGESVQKIDGEFESDILYFDNKIIYGKGEAVDYSSSAEFNGYEYYLSILNGKSLNGCGSEDSESEASTLINSIAEMFENHDEMRTISVNDKELAVVNNYDRLKTALGPVEVTVSQEFTFPANARDISFSIKHNGSEDWVSKTLSVTGDGETKTATFTLYYSDDDDKDTGYTISASYKIDAVTKTITKNNVVTSGDNVVITLDISKEVCEALVNRGTIGEEKYDSYKTYIGIGDNEISGTLSWNDAATFTMDKGDFDSALGNATSADGNFDFKIVANIVTEEYSIVDIEFTSHAENTTIDDFADLCSVTDTMGYVVVDNVSMSSLAGYYDPSTRTIDIEGLTAALGDPNKIVFYYVAANGTVARKAVGNKNDNGYNWPDLDLAHLTVNADGDLVESEDDYARNFTSWKIVHSNTEFAAKEIGDPYNSTVDFGVYSITFNGNIENKYLSGTGIYDTFADVPFERHKYKYTLQNNNYRNIITVKFNGETPSDTNTYGYTIYTYDKKLSTDTLVMSGKTYYILSGTTYEIVNNTTGKNPSQEGWYEDVVRTIIQGIMKAKKLSTDKQVVEGKTYYTLSGTTYSKVEIPTGDPSEQGWYEDETILTSKNWISSAEITKVKTETTPAVAITDNSSIELGQPPYTLNGYRKTTDTEVKTEGSITKVYFEYSDGTFTQVKNPTGSPSEQGWYELYSITIETGSEILPGGSEKIAYTSTNGYYLYENGYRKVTVIEDSEDNAKVYYYYLTNQDASTIWKSDAVDEDGSVSEWNEVNVSYADIFDNNIGIITYVKNNYIYILKNVYEGLHYESGKSVTYNDEDKELQTPIYYANSESYSVASDYSGVKNDSVTITKVLTKSEDEEVVNGKTYYTLSGTTYEIVNDTTGEKPSEQGWYEDAGVSSLDYVTYSDGEFKAEQKDSCVYAYVADCEKVESNPIVNVESDQDAKNISYVVLNSQIYGSTISIISGVKLIGREHLYKVPSGNNHDTIFSSNAGTIKNLTAAGAISGRQLTEDTSFLIKTNSGTVSNINAYGSLINVNNTGIAINPVSSSTAFVLNSNITVTVLDAVDETSTANPNGASVTTSIVENFETNNILISGDGVNGRNGTDGSRGEDGKNGGNAGKGGDITTGSGSGTKFIRSGADGKNGYGGNGGNGYFKGKGKAMSKAEILRLEMIGLYYEGDSSARIVEGGNGGQKGSESGLGNGTNGRTVNFTTYSGNSGIDGFGRIENNILYYLNEDGSTSNITWDKTENSENPRYHIFGFAGDKSKWINVCTKNYNKSEPRFNHWGWAIPGYEIWYELDRVYYPHLDTMINDFKASYNDAGLNDAGLDTKTTVYFRYNTKINYWGWEFDCRNVLFTDYSRINIVDVFTQGEIYER